jgi:hypothetical protein
MRGRRAHRPHLEQAHRDAATGALPSGFRAGQPGAHNVNRLLHGRHKRGAGLALLYGPVQEEIAMARLPYVEVKDASPEVREIYDKVLRGQPGSVQKLLAHRPELLKTFLPFYGTVGRTLDRRVYESVYIRVSMINQCHY